MGDKLRTLSDAMILGSTFRPQYFGDIYQDGHTCALGAAAEAIGIDVTKFEQKGGPDNMSIQDALEARFTNMVTANDCKCPLVGECTNGFPYTVHDLVVHLNDKHMWKRERIAAYLKTKGL